MSTMTINGVAVEFGANDQDPIIDINFMEAMFKMNGESYLQRVAHFTNFSGHTFNRTTLVEFITDKLQGFPLVEKVFVSFWNAN